MSDPMYRRSSSNDLDTLAEPSLSPGVPGKVPTTARLSGRSQFIFRVESAEAATALAGAFGARDSNGVAAGSDVAVERAASSSGQALPGDIKDRFEGSLGADLSSVRVHTGSASAEAASAVGAKAYTTGQDIHFGAGHYDPSSAFGVHLLAHEVAHTVQQQGAAPTRQNKLEVSTPQDGAEVEADRAADAMVAGRSAEVSGATGLSRITIQRNEAKTVNINAAEYEPYLKESIGAAQAKNAHEKSGMYTWGSGAMSTKNEKGQVVDNDADQIVANAKHNGSFADLKGLSTELDLLKPSVIAWQTSEAAVNAIVEKTLVEIGNPEKYKAKGHELDQLHDKMNNTKDPVVVAIKQQLHDAKTSKHKVAAAKVKEALAKVRGAEQKIALRKAELEQAKLGLDKEKNAVQMKSIEDAIKNCVSAMGHVTNLSMALLGAVGTIDALSLGTVADEAAMSGEGCNAKQYATNDEAINLKLNPYLPKSVTAGAGALKGAAGSVAGDVLTAFLEGTVFYDELAACKAQQDKINIGIAMAHSAGQQATNLSIEADFDAALENLKAAKLDLKDSQDSFMTGLINAGKAWDQRDKTKEEIDLMPKMALPSKPGEVSMEGIMALYGALQTRGTARGAFADASSRCKYLQPGIAEGIVARALNSGKASANQDLPLGTQMSIDDPAIGTPPAVRILLEMECDALRNGVAFALDHFDYLKTNQGKDANLEARWEAVISYATVGEI